MPREELNRKLNMEYQDVTTRVLKRNKKHYKVVEQQYYIDENGNKYAVDGKSVLMKHTEKEKEVAKILGEIYGGKDYYCHHETFSMYRRSSSLYPSPSRI